MGIISRFGDIISANVNDMIDKMEDPGKMIDHTIRKLTEDLAEVKKETASVMGEAKTAERNYRNIKEQSDKYLEATKKALSAGNEADAQVLMAKKQSYDSQLAIAKQTYDVAKANADKMQQMYNKLTSDIATLNARRENVKAQVSMAKAQKRVAKATSSMSKTNALDGLARWEAKAQKMLDASSAEIELSDSDILGVTDEASMLAAKYEIGATSSSVTDELASLKASMGLS